ncbi:hypothetical protein B0H19DRAFT_1376819 [Mycena capillaripes]|nr:hypothetical protein B0H19DRAFT_1376819 [Mycena capillaripes]
MVAVVCGGCGIEFKGRGYTLHLRLTTNSPCVAISQREGARGLHGQLQDEEIGKPEDHGLPTGQFEGDFFGNYTPNDFGYIESDDGDDASLSGSDGEDEGNEEEEYLEAEHQAQLANTYEAPRPATSEDASMLVPENNAPVLTAPAREIRKAAEDRFHHKPIVDKYPGGLAGKPISTTLDQTSEKAYESTIGSTESNPYAPFTSKMDWELAKWAKLRGAGSTAFTDLLNIEGVRDSLNLSYAPDARGVIHRRLSLEAWSDASNVLMRTLAIHRIRAFCFWHQTASSPSHTVSTPSSSS